MNFNRSVPVSDVLTSLKDAALQDKFRVFKVDTASLKPVSLPNGGSETTAQGTYIYFVINFSATKTILKLL